MKRDHASPQIAGVARMTQGCPNVVSAAGLRAPPMQGGPRLSGLWELGLQGLTLQAARMVVT